jgi:hypothetical protein
MTSGDGDTPSDDDSDPTTSEPRESYWSGRLAQPPRPPASRTRIPSPGVPSSPSTRTGPLPIAPKNAPLRSRQDAVATKKNRKRLVVVVVAIALIGGTVAGLLISKGGSPASTGTAPSGVAASTSRTTATPPTGSGEAGSNPLVWTHIPSGSPLIGFQSVSCTSETACTVLSATHAYSLDGANLALTDAQAVDTSSLTQNQLAAVSCGSLTFCAAIDGGGNAYVGTPTWSAAQSLVDYRRAGLTGVSCAPNELAQPTCLAISGNGAVFSLSDSRWTQVISLSSRFYPLSISCASATFCAVVGQGGMTAMLTGSVATTHVRVSQQIVSYEGLYPQSVSCTSSRFCMALKWPYAWTYDGSQWSAPTRMEPPQLPLNLAEVQAVSCAAQNFCLAAGAGGVAYAYMGSSWQRYEQVPSIGYGTNASVSCPSTTFCAATLEGWLVVGKAP